MPQKSVPQQKSVPPAPQPHLWAVYERLDRHGCFVCQLRVCRDGTYEARVGRFAPRIAPLPLSVYTTRAAAERAVTLLYYNCAGSA